MIFKNDKPHRIRHTEKRGLLLFQGKFSAQCSAMYNRTIYQWKWCILKGIVWEFATLCVMVKGRNLGIRIEYHQTKARSKYMAKKWLKKTQKINWKKNARMRIKKSNSQRTQKKNEVFCSDSCVNYKFVTKKWCRFIQIVRNFGC